MPWCVPLPRRKLPWSSIMYTVIWGGGVGIFLHMVFKSWVWPPFNKLLMWPRALHSNWNKESKTNKLWHLNNISVSISAPLNLLLAAAFISELLSGLLLFALSFANILRVSFLKGGIFKTFSVRRCSHLAGYKSSTIFLKKLAEKRELWSEDGGSVAWLLIHSSASGGCCLVCPHLCSGHCHSQHRSASKELC